jgi:RND family efflux transporter MFP subunit
VTRPIVTLLVLLALALPARAQEAPPAGSTAPAGPSAPTVSVAPAVSRELVQRQLVTGSLAAREEVQVAAQLDGLRITEVLVEAGDRVAAGQVLARLDAAQIRVELAQNDAAIARGEAAVAQAKSQIAEAEATLAEARASLQRTEALRRSRNATQAALDEKIMQTRTAESRLAAARDGVRLAEAQLAEIRAAREAVLLRLAYTELTAPTAGIVSERTARVGAVASSAAGPLFRIIENGEVELAADVAEQLLAVIRPGQTATVRVTGRDEPLTGTVRLVDPKIDMTTRLGRVRVALPGATGLTLGTFARAEIETARRSGVAVPLSAVLFDATGAKVQVVEGEIVRTRAVETGIKAGDMIEIVSGLAAGETVVAVSGTFLRDGDRVRPVAIATLTGS